MVITQWREKPKWSAGAMVDEHACITAIGRDDDLFKVNSSVFEDKLEKSRRTLLELSWRFP